jgi:hypothetical protein
MLTETRKYEQGKNAGFYEISNGNKQNICLME